MDRAFGKEKLLRRILNSVMEMEGMSQIKTHRDEVFALKVLSFDVDNL